MPSSKGVTPYKYVAKNIFTIKIFKKREKLASNMEDLTMEQKNFHREQNDPLP